MLNNKVRSVKERDFLDTVLPSFPFGNITLPYCFDAEVGRACRLATNKEKSLPETDSME